MTEKQYKGIAGNFLICDVQKEYAEHLLSILVKRFGMRFQFHFFSNVKKIEQFAEKAEIEILLIAEDCVSEIRGNVKAKKKFILSESMKKRRKPHISRRKKQKKNMMRFKVILLLQKEK